MVSYTIGLLVLLVSGPLLKPNEAAPVKEDVRGYERSYKRELELFSKEVQDDWKHDDHEYLSRDELRQAHEQEKIMWSDNENDVSREDNKRWLNVDVPTNEESNDALSPTYDAKLPKNGELFQEDIVMDDYVRSFFNGEAEKRDAVSLTEYRWPNGIVYYRFDPHIDCHSKAVIQCAIEEYRKYTCIKFVEVSPDTLKDHVRFISNGSACYSNVGRRKGGQDVSIGYGCLRVGTPIHELMHVLGFFHEMARVDRDEFATIHFEHIRSDMRHNFLKTPAQLDETLIEYNFCSVMHYSNTAFSKDGEATITSKADPEKEFGQRCGFSVGDIMEINKLYKCPEYNTKFDKSDIEKVIGDPSESEIKGCKLYKDSSKEIKQCLKRHIQINCFL